MLTAAKQIEPAAPLPALAGDLRGRPMWNVRGLVSLLDRHEDGVMRLIDDGELLYAFDLSLEPDRARCRELRVPAVVVDCFLQRRQCKLELSAVVTESLPHDEPILTGREIQRLANVSAAHVTALIRRRCFVAVSEARRGPRGTAQVRADSFAKFLIGRVFY